MQVRLRHEFETATVVLADIPLSEVNKVIPALKEWGVYVRGPGDQETLTGQFVLDHENGSAYFEVVVSE